VAGCNLYKMGYSSFQSDMPDNAPITVDAGGADFITNHKITVNTVSLINDSAGCARSNMHIAIIVVDTQTMEVNCPNDDSPTCDLFVPVTLTNGTTPAFGNDRRLSHLYNPDQGCYSDDDCDDDTICDTASRVCLIPCTSTLDCNYGGINPQDVTYCNATNGTVVANAVCVQCNVDQDCTVGFNWNPPTAAGPNCVSNECVHVCQSNADCPNEICNTDRGVCVDCLTNQDCPYTNPKPYKLFCDDRKTVSTCVECVEEVGGCEDAYFGDKHCKSGWGSPAYYVSEPTCVSCLDDTHCTDVAPNCDTDTNGCKWACETNDDCAPFLVCGTWSSVVNVRKYCEQCFDDDDCPQKNENGFSDYCELHVCTAHSLDTCFPGSAVVEVEGRGVTAMEDLEIGDRVLSLSHSSKQLEYLPVYVFGHQMNNRDGMYVNVACHAEGEDDSKDVASTLQLSENHFARVCVKHSDEKDISDKTCPC
jgi:hypothetical protein